MPRHARYEGETKTTKIKLMGEAGMREGQDGGKDRKKQFMAGKCRKRSNKVSESGEERNHDTEIDG